jgi:hypothetical protein
MIPDILAGKREKMAFEGNGELVRDFIKRSGHRVENESQVAEKIGQGQSDQKALHMMFAALEAEDATEDRIKRQVHDIGKHHPFRERRRDEFLDPDRGLNAENSLLQVEDGRVVPVLEDDQLQGEGQRENVGEHQLDGNYPDPKPEGAAGRLLMETDGPEENEADDRIFQDKRPGPLDLGVEQDRDKAEEKERPQKKNVYQLQRQSIDNELLALPGEGACLCPETFNAFGRGLCRDFAFHGLKSQMKLKK